MPKTFRSLDVVDPLHLNILSMLFESEKGMTAINVHKNLEKLFGKKQCYETILYRLKFLYTKGIINRSQSGEPVYNLISEKVHFPNHSIVYLAKAGKNLVHPIILKCEKAEDCKQLKDNKGCPPKCEIDQILADYFGNKK